MLFLPWFTSKIRPILKLDLLTTLLRDGKKTLTGCLLIASFGDCALAQTLPNNIRVDNSLGSVVTPSNPNNTELRITGGVLRGGNLFHSFQDFNVQGGQTALFQNPGVTNILGRVTGGRPSEIFGTLGVSGGNANLFLINPSGITFGPNASLQLGGSFVATTANAIGFGNLEDTFNASNLNVPSVRLTVDPSILIFNQLANQPPLIQVNRAVLRVGSKDNPQTLLLAGGNVQIDGGNPNNIGNLQGAAGSDIQIGAFTGTGSIGLDNLHLNLPPIGLPTGLRGATVTLTNGAIVNTGSANNDAGNILIAGGTVSLTNSSQISTSTFGAGAAGIVALRADNVSLDRSSIFSRAVENSNGNAGNISITAGSFSMNNSRLDTENRGTGVSGNINRDRFFAPRCLEIYLINFRVKLTFVIYQIANQFSIFRF